MNAENLIIAHFDDALSAEQEVELQQLLASSPEARSLYERHEAMENLMEKDSASLAPSDHLDEVVIASALGLMTEISGGAGLWFSGKIVAALSAVAIGGIAVAVVATSGPDAQPIQPQRIISPTVLQLPTLPVPAEAPVVQPAEHSSAQQAAEASADEQTRSVQRTNTRSTSTNQSDLQQKPTTSSTLDLDNEKPTKMEHGTKMNSEQKPK